MLPYSLFYILILASLISSTTHAQKNIPMEGYRDATLWLFESAGNYGLKDKDQVLVPAKYEVVLPTMQADFSFIVLDKKLGVFDHTMQKEILLLGDYDKVALYPGKDGNYYAYFTKIYPRKQQVYALSRNAANELVATQCQPVSLAISREEFYQNGIELIDSTHVVHHFSHVSWDKVYGGDSGEEEVKYRRHDDLQRSGVFSLQSHTFVIPPTYAEIEPPIERLKPFYTRYFQVTQVLDTNPFEVDDPAPEREPEDAYRYGFYDKRYNKIIDNQKNTPYLIENGGFYLSSATSDGVSVALYDAAGKKIFALDNFDHGVYSVIAMHDRMYIGTHGDTEADIEMAVNTYHIYQLDGTFLKKVKFHLEDFVNNDKAALVSVTQSPTSYDMFYGVYDLENSRYGIPTEYVNITKNNFEVDGVPCPAGIPCTYYFDCDNGLEYVQFDSTYKRFKP